MVQGGKPRISVNQSSHPPLINALLNPKVYNHPTDPLTLFETHISWVLLVGPFAYKIKKPLKLGFLDYSTLEKREFYCREELRLNRRLAPNLYLEVVPITGTAETPRIDQEGIPIEYAVKMRVFLQKALLSHAIEEGKLTSRHIDTLAREVADFHQQIDVAPTATAYGTPVKILEPMRANFEALLRANLDPARLDQITHLARWSEHYLAEHEMEFVQRKERGFIRECHGDMHLGNIILDNGSLTIFDGIEFNESLRWIDVMNEVAFCTMDLHHRGRSDFAHRFLNAYVQETGDYRGLGIIKLYFVYRALVRAKVAWIRLEQEETEGMVEPQLFDELHTYLDLAEKFTVPSSPHLFITHGVSGTGKTVGTQSLIDSIGAIRLRSDVERKRLAGLHWATQTHSELREGLYSPSVTAKTYDSLAQHAETLLKAGFHVIADATFLHRGPREQFKQLATRLKVGFHILSFTASDQALRRRITTRMAEQRDASEATPEVLEQQLKNQNLLEKEELRSTIHIDSETQSSETLIAQVRPFLSQ